MLPRSCWFRREAYFLFKSIKESAICNGYDKPLDYISTFKIYDTNNQDITPGNKVKKLSFYDQLTEEQIQEIVNMFN